MWMVLVNSLAGSGPERGTPNVDVQAPDEEPRPEQAKAKQQAQDVVGPVENREPCCQRKDDDESDDGQNDSSSLQGHPRRS